MPEPQQQSIQAASANYTTAHSNAGSLTHWGKSGIEPMSSWMLVGFVNHWTIIGTSILGILFSLPVYTLLFDKKYVGRKILIRGDYNYLGCDEQGITLLLAHLWVVPLHFFLSKLTLAKMGNISTLTSHVETNAKPPHMNTSQTYSVLPTCLCETLPFNHSDWIFSFYLSHLCH